MARDPGEDFAVEIRDKVMQPTSIQEIKLKVGMYYIVTSAQGNGGVYIILALRYILTIIILHRQENQVVLYKALGGIDLRSKSNIAVTLRGSLLCRVFVSSAEISLSILLISVKCCPL